MNENLKKSTSINIINNFSKNIVQVKAKLDITTWYVNIVIDRKHTYDEILNNIYTVRNDFCDTLISSIKCTMNALIFQ